ncbi:hypothetical protein TRFO_16042 [Tritrichomonas foetus]|uniref:VPS9 domain-containing protein n=1 Tax=Tritrichomonas foetus TaxID=1144522 RepID=A0A1J4KRL0_9EUKA|nr:hypothetical protein TRFO_16042 [Tritrichomonas foetus]|eukprot:OHT13722.1 hypothetical protein TRFO_16042 [Tritrichomonas foetus]
MFFSWSNISHNLNEIHQQAKEVAIQNNFLISHIKMKQMDVLQKIDQVQKDMSFSTLLMSFYNIEDAASLTDFYWNFYKFEIINDPSEYGFPKPKLTMFIQQFTKNLTQLASILDFKSMDPSECPPVPFRIDPIEYLLYSTIPSLFGHFWCSELIEKYIDFIFTAALTNPSFSDVYLEMSFSNFIRTTCNSKFFSQSLGPALLEILQSDLITIEGCAADIIAKMHENIFLLPRHVRRMISRFSNPDESTIFSPSVFVANCLVIPPLKYPKEWGVIDSKFSISESGYQILERVSELISSIAQGALESNELTYSFYDFVNDAAEVDDKKDTISISDILPLLGKESISLIFSLPDISLLAYLVEKSPCSMLLKGTAEHLIHNKILPHLFFSCDIKEIRQYRIMPSGSLFKANNESFKASLVSAIFSFFEISNVFSDAPSNSIKEFIEFHQMHSKNVNDTKVVMALRLIDSLRPKEWTDIMPSLDDELRRQRKFIETNSAVFMELAILNQKFDEITAKISDSFTMAIGAHTSRLYDDFLRNNSELKVQFSDLSPEFLASSERFTEFFNNSRYLLKDYTNKSPQTYEPLLHYHHCWMLKQLTFEKFQQVHSSFSGMDKVIEKADEKVIESFCVAPAPAKIRYLFRSNTVFEEARSLLAIGRSIENPLIALPSMAAAIEVLNRMYLLEFEKNAQADELTPLIHYLFLSSKIPSLYSFIKYLDFYITPLVDQQILTLNENHVVGFTHLINHMDSLFSFLTANGHS